MTRLLTEFDATVISAQIITSQDENRVWSQEAITTREHEGEIRGVGSTVQVNVVGDVEIKKHEPNTDIDGPDRVSVTTRELVVDQLDYFNVGVDDVDAVFGAGRVLDTVSARAGVQLAEVEDEFLAGKAAAGAGIKGTTLGTQAAPLHLVTPQDAYKLLVSMRTRLTRGKVSKSNRYAFLSPEIEALLLEDGKFVNTNQAALYTGEIGSAAGFRLISTNVIPETSGVQSIVAGVPGALAAVGALQKVKAYEPEARFEAAVKGLNVYGAEVLRPELLACAKVDFTAPSEG